MEFADVWYATEERSLSRSALVAFDDVGVLRLSGRDAQFVGRHRRLELHDVGEPQLQSQAWNWVVYLWGNVVLLPVYAFWAFQSYSAGRPLEPLGLPALIVAANVAGYWVGRMTKWVVLEGTTSDGERITCYFAGASGARWIGMNRDTKRMYEQLCRA